MRPDSPKGDEEQVMPDPKHPRDEAPAIPGEWGVDEDPYTEEDGVGDDVNGPLPEIQDKD
jgi:hypothetical protein